VTNDAYREIVALRARIAELERMAATMTKGDPMYQNTEASDQDKVQRRLRAESWRPDADMEVIVARLAADPDDPRITPTMRMSSALYREAKAAAMAERPPRLDTTKGDRS